MLTKKRYRTASVRHLTTAERYRTAAKHYFFTLFPIEIFVNIANKTVLINELLINVLIFLNVLYL